MAATTFPIMDVDRPRPSSATPLSPPLPIPRRRRTLTTSTSRPRGIRRTQNHVRVRPADPEVISALISSLSAISLPGPSQFDGLQNVHAGRPSPAFASARQTSLPASFYALRPQTSAYESTYTGRVRAHTVDIVETAEVMEEGAEFPIIRTSKRPSETSLVSFKQRHTSQQSAKSSRAPSGGSVRVDYKGKGKEIEGDNDEQVIMEPGQKKSSASIRSVDSKSGHSLRNFKLRRSRERLKSRENESRVQTPIDPRPSDDSLRLNGIFMAEHSSASRGSPKKTFIPEEPIHEEPFTAGPSTALPARTLDSRQSATVVAHTCDSPIVDHGRLVIPDRRSSLGQLDSPVMRKKHRRTSSRLASSSSDAKEFTQPSVQDQMLEKQPKRIPSPVMASDYEPEEANEAPIEQNRPQEATEEHQPQHEQPQKVYEEQSVQPLSTQPQKAFDFNEDNEVTRRIKQLKAQIEERNRRPPEPEVASSPKHHGVVGLIAEPPLPPKEPPKTATAFASKQIAQALGTDERIEAQPSDAPAVQPPEIGISPHATTEPENVLVKDFAGSNMLPNQPSATDDVKISSKSSPSHRAHWSHPDIPLKAEKRHNREVSKQQNSSAVQSITEERHASSGPVDDSVIAYLQSPRFTQRIRNPQTGRTICFSEVGDPKGFPVFCCVGMGLTRYIMAFYDELAATLNLRLITPDRPGVGESESYPEGAGVPLVWPDDVLAICEAINIEHFSLLAHSAGAIYALATALRMPQNIRCRVHLLAPWIPPSQMSSAGLRLDAPPAGNLPRSQRFLRILPAPLLRAVNAGFFGASSASMKPKSARKQSPGQSGRSQSFDARQTNKDGVGPLTPRSGSIANMDQVQPNTALSSLQPPESVETNLASDRPRTTPMDVPPHQALRTSTTDPTVSAQTLATDLYVRRRTYDSLLTLRTWALATSNANPATDLLICLERYQPIGFRYVDITRPVVIHHGSKDSRVPVENVRWLGALWGRPGTSAAVTGVGGKANVKDKGKEKTGKDGKDRWPRCEVRILEGEGHGLMAAAGVMGGVLAEISSEWEQEVKWREKRKAEKERRRSSRGMGVRIGSRGTVGSE